MGITLCILISLHLWILLATENLARSVQHLNNFQAVWVNRARETDWEFTPVRKGAPGGDRSRGWRGELRSVAVRPWPPSRSLCRLGPFSIVIGERGYTQRPDSAPFISCQRYILQARRTPVSGQVGKLEEMTESSNPVAQVGELGGYCW